MSFALSIIIGLAVLFFLKELILFGPLIAGFISGVISKSAITGLFAGMFVALLGALIFYRTPIGAVEVFKDTAITGLAFYEGAEPIGVAKAIFGISGVAAATAAGFIGGLVSK